MNIIIDNEDQSNFVGLRNNQIILPKNTGTLKNQEQFAIEKFLPEFETFIHSIMKVKKQKKSPVTIKKPNENGSFDEINIHSSKLEAWYALYKELKKSIINKASKTYIHTNIFNSKTIERTISRGMFLISENNSPIFNQGLLNNDDNYRIHYQDELYSFGAFILDKYNKLMSINENVNSEMIWLAKSFSSKYGFKEDFDINDKIIKQQILSILENITKTIQPKTADIKNLESAIRKVILGKDVIVGTDNFQLLWEMLVSGALKNLYGNSNVFVENDICNYKDNGHHDEENLYPDIVYINNEDTQEINHTLHILDPKYKLFGNLEDNELIKQILYIQNFLNPDINKQIKVDTNLYFIYPSFGKAHRVQTSFKIFQIYKIPLNYITLFKIYNKRNEIKDNALFNFLDKQALIQPSNIFKPWIPECCTYANGQKVHTVANGKYEKYANYMLNKQKSHNLTNKYFKTKPIAKFQK